MPDQTSVYADRASFGVADAAVPTGVLRLGALAAAAAGGPRLALDASGNVTAGVLTAADIPPAFVRRDVAETIGASWTWAPGTTIAFAPGAVAAPAATSRSVGTRLVIEPVGASTEYALGRDVNAQWASVPVGKLHQWYQGATERLRLDTDGTLKVINGSGALLLDAAGTGLGNVAATGSLQFAAFGGGIVFHSWAGVINPNVGYHENLGQINRKYLSLHCAELWSESLVAQDTIATIGGRVLVGPTSVLTRDVAPGDSVIYTKHNAFGLYVVGVEYGSKLVLQSAGKFEVMQVASTSVPVATSQGDYAYDVARGSAGTASQWFAGDAVFDTGKVTTGPGAFIDLYSVNGLRAGSSAGPTIVGNVRTGGGATDWREHWAIGNLQGVYATSTRKFGAAFGDVAGTYLQIDATDGIRMIRAGLGITGQWAMNGDVAFGYQTAGQLLFTASTGQLRVKYAGVDRMVLHSDGTLRLATALIVGGWSLDPVAVRSYYAGAWNSGNGFLFAFDPTSNKTTALVGDAAGRRLQWDGASLKVVSDGLTIDENGIQMVQATGTTTEVWKQVRWGTVGGVLWDTSVGGSTGTGRFELLRANGDINVVTNSGQLTLQAGGSAIDRAYVRVSPTWVEIGGGLTGGLRPSLLPEANALHDLGASGRRWKYAWMVNLMLGATSPAFPTYELQLMNDSAVKPTSTVWTVVSDARSKRDVVPVDRAAALALVQRVPLVRFVQTGAFGTTAGAAGIGVVAQDVAPLLPNSVTASPHDGSLAWNAHELLMLNVAAVQALAARLDAVEGKDRR